VSRGRKYLWSCIKMARLSGTRRRMTKTLKAVFHLRLEQRCTFLTFLADNYKLNWAHSMGPYRSPLSSIVVVVVLLFLTCSFSQN